MVHDLQQDVENIRMGLFDLVEQQHGMRFFGHSLSEQTALIKANIARRGPDEAGHRMAFHVLRHIKADQLNAQNEGELLGDLGLTNPGWPGEEEGTDRFFGFAKTRARHFDRRSKRFDCLILAKNNVLKVAIEHLQFGAIIA